MSLETFSDEIANLYTTTQGGVVRVQERDEAGNLIFQGSGILWQQKGLVITVSYPFQNPERIEVIHGEDPPAIPKVRGWDNRYNLSVLEIPHFSSWDRWSDLGNVSPGTLVFSLGYRDFRSGMVARTQEVRENPWGGVVKPWIEVDGTLGPHTEGGALVSTKGAFLGIVSSHPGPYGQVLGYGQLENLVQSIIMKGTVNPGYLGVRTSPGKADGVVGLVVTQVEEGSPAEAAGIVLGDTLLSIGGRGLNQPRNLFVALRSMTEGEETTVELIRAGERRSLKVVLGTRTK